MINLIVVLAVVFYLAYQFKIIPFGMSMNITKSNILAEPVWLFVAVRSSESTAVTLPSLAEVQAGGSATWKHLGGFENEQLKVNGEPYSMMLQDGTPGQTGIGVKIEAPLAQSDYTNLQLAESFINSTVDVLLVSIKTNTKAYRYQKLGVTVGFTGNHSQKKANVIPFTAEREADKFTTAMDVVTLS